MKKRILIGLLGSALLLGAGATSLAASKGKAPSLSEIESESETESESESESESEIETETAMEKKTKTETETEPETESEQTILIAPDLTLKGVVAGGYAGTITLRTDDGEEYVVSFANAKTDFSDSGLYEGMTVKCVLEDITSDEDGIFTAKEITTDSTWE